MRVSYAECCAVKPTVVRFSHYEALRVRGLGSSVHSPNILQAITLQ
jgi:hypothetical protein